MARKDYCCNRAGHPLPGHGKRIFFVLIPERKRDRGTGDFKENPNITAHRVCKSRPAKIFLSAEHGREGNIMQEGFKRDGGYL